MPRSLIKIITTMGLFSPTFETLRDLYLNELRDLYSAETQLAGSVAKDGGCRHVLAAQGSLYSPS